MYFLTGSDTDIDGRHLVEMFPHRRRYNELSGYQLYSWVQYGG